MNIKEFITERINKNKLSVDIDECLNVIEKYKDIYPGISDTKLFYYFIKNKVGGILNNIDHDYAEMFGNLKIKNRENIIFYEFEFEEDYLEWQPLRLEVYSKIINNNDIRLLNYVELSNINLISDTFTKCKYELIYNSQCVSTFNKIGHSTDQDTQSFIIFLSGKFKDGYSFKPIK